MEAEAATSETNPVRDRDLFGGFGARVTAFLIDVLLVSLVVTLLALAYNAIYGKKFVISPAFSMWVDLNEDTSSRQVVNDHGQHGTLNAHTSQRLLYGVYTSYIVEGLRMDVVMDDGHTANAFMAWPQEWVVDKQKVEKELLALKLPATQEDLNQGMARAFGDLVQNQYTPTSYLEWMVLIVYFILFEGSRFKGTPGKRLMKLSVVDDGGNAIGYGASALRNVGKAVSALVLLIGFLMVIWTKRSQGLHDKMAKTFVVKDAKLATFQNSGV